jgi:hypothetical protein
VSQQATVTTVTRKTSYHCTILRLRDRFGAHRIFPDVTENTEIIRLIVQTIPHIFWIKLCEPPSGRRCNLREIVKEIRASSKAKSLYPFRSLPFLTQRMFAHLHKSFLWRILYVEQKQIRFIPLQPSMRGHL